MFHASFDTLLLFAAATCPFLRQAVCCSFGLVVYHPPATGGNLHVVYTRERLTFCKGVYICSCSIHPWVEKEVFRVSFPLIFR